uniref:Uncharacterized protein n=1 Tax=Physcomitrium patens TaxID=3218 RepID=A0A2K1L0T2_PHYPA|nr:hypothetical protein PHYPA_002423 [Physcomitrium patens]
MASVAQPVTLLRFVVREDFCRSLADRLVTDIKRVLEHLDARPSRVIQALVTESAQRQTKEAAAESAAKYAGSEMQCRGHGGGATQAETP